MNTTVTAVSEVGIFLLLIAAWLVAAGPLTPVALTLAGLAVGLAILCVLRGPPSSSPPRTPDRLAVRARALFLGLVSAAFVAWSIHFIAKSSVQVDGRTYYSLFDDAMVSMRYAWNLAHGMGLVWNPGERVEGFTNPLMVFIMALPAAVLDKSHAVLAIQLLGIPTLLGIAAFAMRIADELLADREPSTRMALSCLAFATVLLYYPLAYWTLLGMETGLVALLAATAAWLLVRRGSGPRPLYLLPVLLGLMFWTRPDALVQGGIIWAFRARSLRWSGRRILAKETAIWAAFVVVQLAARRAYYDEWLPNTYVLKLTGLPLGLRLENGWLFVKLFLKEMWLPYLLALAGLALAFNWRLLLVVLLFTSATVYQIWVGGDPWLQWRIMAPYVPLLMLGGAYGVMSLFRLLRAQAAARLSAVAAVAVLAVELGAAEPRFREYLRFDSLAPSVPDNRFHAEIGLKLAGFCDPEASVGTFWSGTLPYYSGTRAVDFLGKMDKHIAGLKADPKLGFGGMKSVPGHNKYDLHYSIEQLRPDYIEAVSWGHDNMRDFVAKNYVKVHGAWLLKDSPHIQWERARRKR